LTPRGTFNYYGYEPDDYEIASKVEAAATATSRARTQEIMTDLFAFLARDQPLTWLFNDNAIVGYRNGVGGLPEPDSFWDKPDPRTLTLRSAGSQ
jgi:ABC-type transport system substrate-binding protein